MSKTIHFNDRTGEIGIGTNTTSDGEEIMFKIKDYEVVIVTSKSANSIEISIDKRDKEKS